MWRQNSKQVHHPPTARVRLSAKAGAAPEQHLTSPTVPEKLVTSLSILDVAAGDGIVGVELRKRGTHL